MSAEPQNAEGQHLQAIVQKIKEDLEKIADHPQAAPKVAYVIFL